MMILITYDVETISAEGRKRLRQVAKQCVNNGQRVQNSVFECMLDPAQLVMLKYRIEEIIDKKKDSVRFYQIGNNWKPRVDHIGIKESYDPEDTMII